MPPLPEIDDDAFLSEEVLQHYRDKPVGYKLKERLAKNKSLPHRTGLHEWHTHERTHIADPLDYLGTKPDNEIRWQK